MGFATVVGFLLGLALAVGIAFVICASSLAKSNDFGDTKIPIDQYTGYTPPQVTNCGQVSGGSSGWNSAFMTENEKKW